MGMMLPFALLKHKQKTVTYMFPMTYNKKLWFVLLFYKYKRCTNTLLLFWLCYNLIFGARQNNCYILLLDPIGSQCIGEILCLRVCGFLVPPI